MVDVKDGRITTYNIEEELELLESLPDSKPSKRIIKTKKGLTAIKALREIREKDNESVYKFIKKRNMNNLDAEAIFYRGTSITFGQFFDKVEETKKSLAKSGLVAGDEIAVCASNAPAFAYILMAANDLGIKVNSFGAHYGHDAIKNILSGTTNKLIFISDDNYEQIKDVVEETGKENVVMYSLADYLPKDPTKCQGYHPEVDKYYHYEDKISEYAKDNSKIKTFNEYLEYGKDYDGPIVECGDLETDFLVTYTSGSTSIPKAMIHKNRSAIVAGKFHDPELCGNPKIEGLRGLATIHPDSNTDIITCMLDNWAQGWSVAMEPEYGADKALDILMMNEPNYANMTTSHLVEAAKDYLVRGRYNGKKMPFLLAAFAVGEGLSRGEEKLINRMLRKARAGSGVSILKGLKFFKFPFVVVSVGGGDCEHGGIYYTLWKAFTQTANSYKLGKEDAGLIPVPFAVVTALKKDANGNWIECNYGEPGVVVANSYTNLSGYKDNEAATQNLIIEDNLGRKWVTCNVYGYVDKLGGVHVKGRVPSKDKIFKNKYLIDDFITKDSKNILSSSTVEVNGNLVATIQFQPFAQDAPEKIINSLYGRLKKRFHEYVLSSIYIRIIPVDCSLPLTPSGKRSSVALENLGLDNTILLSDLFENIKKNVR